jgi:transposase InsO family protein
MTHGETRIRERMGLPKKTAAKRAARAMESGTERTEFAGSLRRYLDWVWHRSDGPCRVLVHNGFVFIERGGIVATMWQLPPKYRNRKAAFTAGGRFLDNIFVERLWRSLKYECVYLHAWSGGSEARRGIGAWIDFYNQRRPHTALAGRTPEAVYWP